MKQKLKKNIVLIDLDLTLLHSILESEKINIEYLITEADDNKIHELKSFYGIKNIIQRQKFHEYAEQSEINLDYEIIEKFRDSQLNSENFQSRYSDDYSLKQYHYYNALSFWVDIFSKKEISAIVLEGRQHGANYDGLALDVAKEYDVSAFIFETYMVRLSKNGMKCIRAILDYGLQKRIEIDQSKLNLQKVDIEKYMFYYDKLNAAQKQKRKTFKEIIKILLPSHFFIVIRMMQKLVFKKKIIEHGFTISPLKILKNIFYALRLKREYNSIAVDCDYSKKYVFYALHFDPEASIMSRTTLSNQLIIIKQLANSLPDDWILYVKDHPVQYKLYMPGNWFYLTSFNKYRTKDFYNEILKYKNVRILKNDINSSKVLKKAMAISTINGTVALEAMTYNLPVILFGHKSTPFGSCKDVFKITSLDQCSQALKKIDSGFQPDYFDLSDIVNKELFELNLTSSNDVKLLIDYMVCQYNSAQKHMLEER